MNGRSLPSAPPSCSPLRRLLRWSADPDAVALRLGAALVLSCLLHFALILLPFLGQSAAEKRLVLKGKQNPPPVINATLASVGEHKFLDVAMPAAAQSAPDPSAPDRPADEAQPLTQQHAEGAGLLPLPAPVFYTMDQLSKRPQPLAEADLDPEQIRPIVASGKIVLKLWINEFGVVTDATVEKTDMPGVFSQTAIAAFKGLRFSPGERDGMPVRSLMRVEVTYDDGRARGY